MVGLSVPSKPGLESLQLLADFLDLLGGGTSAVPDPWLFLGRASRQKVVDSCSVPFDKYVRFRNRKTEHSPMAEESIMSHFFDDQASEFRGLGMRPLWPGTAD